MICDFRMVSSSSEDSDSDNNDCPEEISFKDPNLKSSEVVGHAKEESSSGEDEDDNDAPTTTPLRKELSHLSFQELEDLKQKLGTKAYNEAMFGVQSKGMKNVKAAKKKIIPRENKNRPREMSSKIRPPRVRQVVNVAKKKRRDPRFEALCGEFNEDVSKSLIFNNYNV